MRNVGQTQLTAAGDGNSIGDVSEAGAIEYPVLILKAANILVCGHFECGVMKAVVANNPALVDF